MTLFWSKLFYKCTVMTLVRHNTQPKCATITLFPHMPLFQHQRVNKKVIVAITDSKMRLGGSCHLLEVILSSEKVWFLGLFLVSAFVTGFFSRPRSKYLKFVFMSKIQSLQAY